MTEDEWQNLYENCETAWLLDAVGHLDELRDMLADGNPFEPPQIRTDLLKLHRLAMKVVNNGSQSDLPELTELAFDLEDQVSDMIAALEKVQDKIQSLTELLPTNEFEEDEENFDEDDFSE